MGGSALGDEPKGSFITKAPWPYPAEMSAGMATVVVDASFNITVTNPKGAHKHLHSTASRYTASIKSARGAGCAGANETTAMRSGGGALSKCMVTVKDTTVPLGKGVDESYTLDVSTTSCTITAPTVWGAFHGMESLAQLFGENCTATGAPISITDAPRFGFRGL